MLSWLITGWPALLRASRPAICSGDQPRKAVQDGRARLAIAFQPRAGPAPGLGLLLGVARLVADLTPLLRFSSREMVDAERSRAAAIWRIEWPLRLEAGNRDSALPGRADHSVVPSQHLNLVLHFVCELRGTFPVALKVPRFARDDRQALTRFDRREDRAGRPASPPRGRPGRSASFQAYVSKCSHGRPSGRTAPGTAPR